MLKTILIVDDSPMIRRIVSQLVQQLGYQSITAENGLQGCEMAEEIRPDMIIMDIEMPVMNGFEATWRIKTDQRTAHIPVAFFTTLGSEESIQQAKEAGGVGFLNKPICKEELDQAIRDILGAN
ncbi:MAG: response regulator [Desulfobulbaceae bacterium]|nr:response regulator [Desulfobulbaceae bacterium]HIJ91146.1 response regulator [Deltaproteobacteria bacterium]